MQRRKGTGLAFALLVGSGCAATWTGCSASKQTELVPGVMTQIQVPKDMRAVRIDVQAQGQQSTCQWHSVNPQNPGFITLPRTLGVVPGAGADRLVTITVTGYTKDDGDAPVLQDCATPVQGSDGKYDPNVRILRRTRTSYVGDKILFLPMNLRFSCYDAAQCPPDQTCKAGQCVDAAVDPKSLPEYNDGLVSGASNTCFSEKKCFVDQQPAKVIDQTKCIYGFTVPPQSPFGKGVNVRVFYDSDGGESEVLDGDPYEGFTVDPNNPQQFQLSAGLCGLVNRTGNPPHPIYAVTVASACPTKGLYQPFCNEDIAPGGPVPLPDGGTSVDGGCNVSKQLVPAPSALYVVMDDSSSMGRYFGMQGLETVTSLTLSDPVFRTASVGFKLLPHAAADCSANPTSFATPDVPFGSVTAAQTAVATIVGDPSKVLASDPTMYVDAALRPSGAYGALRSFATSSGKAFNHMAVLLITNRPAAQDCGIGAPSNEAAAALADPTAPIFTYVVALKNDTTPAYDTTELAAIAQKGGTTIFDATTDATIGARAFNTVETDLGSCLYERPDGIDQTARVSYVDPLDLQTTTVPFDGACSAANAATANGWAFDGASRVRICGAACSQLRTVLSNTANAFLAQGKAAPDVPITALMPCNAP